MYKLNQTMEQFKQENTHFIRDLETLKVLADPLRTQILDLLQPQALTVKEMASRLGLAPGKLYYHVNMLEKHGLVRVVETRQVANLTEKWFRAAAANLDVDPALLSSVTLEGQENILSILRSTLEATREDILRSMQARFFELGQGAEPHPRRAIINRTLSQISEEQAEAFAGRLVELIEEFEEASRPSSAEGEANHPYALTIAYFPSFYYREE
jgi:DNA-binding transcriptional ArsR family regulator